MASLLDRITSNPELCGGRPTIRGLRIRVTDILEMLAGGAGRSDILRDYPYLQDEDISAARRYAARNSAHRLFAGGCVALRGGAPPPACGRPLFGSGRPPSRACERGR